MTFHPDSLPDLSGRVYIVTGGNSGIGYNTVARLAQHGAHVYLCARSSTKGSNAIANIKSTYSKANVTLLEMDHNSLSSVVSASTTFLTKEKCLHGLINNAGIMATPYEVTKDGFENQWQTNYIAHWVFTSHLLPLMLGTSKSLAPGSVRIVNLTSSGHHLAPPGGIVLADTLLADRATLKRYGQSKLANILHAKTLNLLYGPSSASSKAGDGEIWTSAVHPGLVDTNLASKTDGSFWKIFAGVTSALGLKQSADTGSFTSLYCAASPEMKAEQSGTYFVQIAKPGKESALAKDMDLAAKLEEWTKVEMARANWFH